MTKDNDPTLRARAAFERFDRSVKRVSRALRRLQISFLSGPDQATFRALRELSCLNEKRRALDIPDDDWNRWLDEAAEVTAPLYEYLDRRIREWLRDPTTAV